MNKVFLLLFGFVYSLLFAQKDKVGINTDTPSATLDVVSKQNTNITKALEINNSDVAELLKVTNAGNVGINIGTGSPGALLHINSTNILNVRHENLPEISSPAYTPPFQKLAVDAAGNGVSLDSSVKYLYYQQTSTYPSSYNSNTNSGGFSLSDPNNYINIPIVSDSGLKGNTIGITFGTDANATVNGQSASNVQYIVIPEPGVYSFEYWASARCNRYLGTQNYTLSGQMQLNIVFATASGTTYTTNTIARGLLSATRNNIGDTTNVSYSYANPQQLVQVLQTSVTNQKIAIFMQYAGGEDNQFKNGECLLNIPNGANTSYYFVITKM